MALQHLRSGTANKRPLPTAMSDGQLAVNTNLASPGLFFKDGNGDLVKVGPVHIGTTAPNASPASTAATALVANTIYKILTVGTSDFTTVGASSNAVGVVFTASGTTTGTGTVSGEQGNEKGEQWLDTTGGTYVLKIYDGTAWRSESGTFVDASGDTMTGDLLFNNANIVFEGSAADDHETTLTVANPTADRTITLPNTTGTVITTGDTGSITSTMITDGTIVNADINASAEIAVSKLANGTARQLLQTDSGGSGVEFTSNVDVPGTLDVTSAATLDSTLTVSGNVVIGTANAESKLWLKNGSSSGSGNGAELNFGNTEGTGSIKYNDVSSKSMLFYVDGYEIMRLQDINTTAGSTNIEHRIGIGTSSPQSMLDVEDGAQFVERSTVGNNDPRIKLEKVVTDGTITGKITTDNLVSHDDILWTKADDSNVSGRIGNAPDIHNAGTDGDLAIQSEAGNIAFVTSSGGGAEQMRIDSSGRLLLGTTTEGEATADNLTIADSGHCGITLRSGTSSVGTIFFSDGTSGSAEYQGYVQYDHSANYLKWATAGTERMRIDSSGRVGIGITSPQTRFHSSGTTNGAQATFGITSSGLKISTFQKTGNDAGVILDAQESTNGTLAFNTRGSERMRIDSSGNVGIGTTGPSQSLTLRGEQFIETNSTAADSGNGIYWQSTTSGWTTSSAHAAIYGKRVDGSNGYLRFDTRSSGTTAERMRIDSSGNVGIGVSSLSSGDGNLTVLADGTGAGTANTRLFMTGYEGTSGNAAGLWFGARNNENTGVIGSRTASGNIAFETYSGGWGERMRIDSAGRVGIGKTNPNTTFEIYEATNPYIYLQNSTTGTGASDGFSLIEFGLDTYINNREAGNMIFLNNGSERLRIDSSGNVGIGVSSLSSSSRLTLLESAGNGQTLEIKGANTGGVGSQPGIKFTASTGDNIGGIFGDTNSDAVVLQSGGTERMRIDSSGATTFIKTVNNTAELLFGYGSSSGIYAGIGGQNHFNTNQLCDLLFYTNGSTGSRSPSERMRIDSSGNVLIGKSSASTSAGTGVQLITGSTASVDVVTNTASNIGVNHIYNLNATRNGYRYYVGIDGGIYNFSGNNVNLSDEREKKNIVDMDSTWSELKQWTLRQFHFNEQDNSEDKCYGVIAQQIETISPQVLSTFETNPTTARKGVKEQKMMWMAIKALQEAMAKIETLEQRLSDAGIA